MKTTDPIYVTIANWFNSDRDYAKGVELFAKYGRNKNLARLMPGRKMRYQRKLGYELSKIIGIDYRTVMSKEVQPENGQTEDTGIQAPLPEFNPENPSELHDSGEREREIHDPAHDAEDPANETERPDPDSDTSDKVSAATSEAELEQYPVIIRRIIYEFHDLYQKRILAHRELRSLENNDDASIAQRAEISDRLAKFSDRMDFLQTCRKEWESTGQIPLEQNIWPVKNFPVPLSRQELADKKKNLQKSLSKDQSLLEFQSKKNGEASQPMPPGPKREKIEARIKQKEAEIEQLQKAIDDIDKAK